MHMHALMTSAPRVAIVGGGIAGSLCGLILRSRGLQPTIFDRGTRRIGGRLAGGIEPDSGAHFLRASDSGSQFAAVLQMLAREGVVAPWNGRMGILGSRGGGFLPATVADGTMVTSMRKDGGAPEGPSDTGDFCGFISGRRSSATPLFVGTPDNAAICERIASLANIPVQRHAVTAAALSPNGGWHIKAGPDGSSQPDFDALVLASHDPSLAAATVATLAESAPEEAASRMNQLCVALRDARLHSQPVFSLSAQFETGSLEALPFDAATVPGSPEVQFVVRDASKPGRDTDGGLLSAVSTAAYARALLTEHADEPAAAVAAAAEGMAREVTRLLAPYGVRPPVRTTAKRWGAGLPGKTLGVDEECISLEPWRFAVCGDFLRVRSSPLEAAAESGLAAGERVATWFSE